MPRAVRLLLAMSLAVPTVVLTATPCLACDCAFLPVAQRLEQADVAVVGEVISQRGAQGGTIQVLRVGGVFAGDVGPQIELFAQIGQGIVDSCAVLLPVGRRVALIADRNADGTYTTSACSLVTEAELRKAVGPPLPPGTASPGPADGARVNDPIVIPGWMVVALGAMLGVVLIAGAMLVPRWRALRRERVDEPGTEPHEV
jgi:hypothetical protein